MRVLPLTRGSATVAPWASAAANSGRVSHSLRNGSVSRMQRACANDGERRRCAAAMACDAAARSASTSASRAAMHAIAQRALGLVQRVTGERVGVSAR